VEKMIDKTEQEIMSNWEGNINKPIVSICCTTYNHEKYIGEALDSFLMQETDFPFEVIVRDDASPDNTAEIIREYEKKYPNIIKPIYEKENGYQRGIRPSLVTFNKAKGEYIAFCEGDDYWTDEKKLQIQKNFLDSNEEFVICYGDVEAFNENGIIENYVGGAKKDLTADELKKTTPINTMTVMSRNKIKSFPPEYNFAKIGDLFIWVLLSEYGKGKYLPQIKPSRYRVHDGGIYSIVNKEKKNFMSFTLFVALYSYFFKIGDDKYKRFYLEKMLSYMISSLGISIFKYFFDFRKIVKLMKIILKK